MSSPLSKYFSGVGAKRLSEVEITPDKSNQHEFNGISEFKEIFGSERIKFRCHFILLEDDEKQFTEDEGFLTWYDSRENHPTRSEFRLYYSSNSVLESANSGDLIVIGRTATDKLAVIVAPKGSTVERQLLWLFGIEEVESKFVVRDFESNDVELGFVGKYVLSGLGIEVSESSSSYLEILLEKFGNKFPKTSEFSNFTRSTLPEVHPLDDPDATLLAWLEREELLFKTLEKNIVSKKLNEGFGAGINDDVDEFISFSLSVQNRRKSRAGHAFENHLSAIFDHYNLKYSKGAKTERNNKPDFLFPGVDYYKAESFDSSKLNMLGVKTTAKDRWRQVLSEADRIPNKHLITLEPAISSNQTDEMKAQLLELVVPMEIQKSYSTAQQTDLMSLSEFINLVKRNQEAI